MMRSIMVSVSILYCLVLSVICTTATATDTTTTNLENDTTNIIRCVTEWGISSSTTMEEDPAKMTIIPPSHINDGYCDCIYSGFDETMTSACSGMNHHNNKVNRNQLFFACPQQPTLQLPMSRINDGICDCCDGADEMVVTTSWKEDKETTTSTTTTHTTTTNHCIDNCASVLATFRAQQKQRQLQYQKGLEIRTKMMASYQTMIQTTKTKIKQLTHDISERTKLLHDKYIRSLTSHYVKYTNIHVQRIYTKLYATMTGLPHDHDRYNKHPLTLLHDVSITELETLIVLTCQMAGEMKMSSLNEDDNNNNNDHHPTQPPQKTCVPLRLAVIETGDMIVQSKNDTNHMILRRLSQDDQYTDSTNNEEEEDILAVMLAQIYNYNSQYYPKQHPIFMEEDYLQLIHHGTTTTTLQKTSSPTKKHHDNDDYEDEEYEVDEYNDEDDHHDTTTSSSHPFIPTTVYEDQMTLEQRTEFQTILMETLPLSKSRQLYQQRMQTLMTYIQDQITQLEQEQSSSETEEDLVLADEIDNAAIPIDHSDEIQQLQQIVTQLQSRMSHIEHGYVYGISALKLLSTITPETMTFHYTPEFIFGHPDKNMKPSVNDVSLYHQQYLQKLFVLTLYYSQLSVQQVYEIFVLSLSPTTTSTTSDDEEEQSMNEQQCTLPYAHLCPPISLLKESMPLPKFIYDTMETFCNNNTLSMEDPSLLSNEATKTTCAATDVIPESIPDGYFGYYPIRPRDENDVVSQLLRHLGHDPAYCTDDEIRTKREMRLIQETVSQYRTNLRSMEQTLQELKETIQNADKVDSNDSDDNDENEDEDNNNTVLPKYGLDGELHSIQDQCYDFTQGKYKYEICLFQGSTQKEIGSTGDGTSLGQWTGTYLERKVENNIEYNERIWKWENGAQCWNGPQRSITAHITQCGPITRIISANEPDTCRYVVEVESPIACDATYQRRYGLE